MNYLQSQDDSEQEGFIPNQIVIGHQPAYNPPSYIPTYQGFHAKYIIGNVILKKQMPACLAPIQHIPQNFRQCCNSWLQNKKETNLNQGLSTANELFGDKSKFTLVYSRWKEPFGSGVKATFEHQVKIQPHRCQNSKLLREWEQQRKLNQHPVNQNSIIFDSKFEGGNLQCAFQSICQPHTYYLFMQSDTNTYGYNQWFYFTMKNIKSKTQYTFKISNFKKKYSFFKRGMQPIVFSNKKAENSDNGWYRDGKNIHYYPSQFRESDCSEYYTLSFQLQFQYDNDCIAISPSLPYSYTKLSASLAKFQQLALHNNLLWKNQCIAKTLANNSVPYITIAKNQEHLTKKPNIIIIARQHSGETWSSYLAQSLIQQVLTSEIGNWIFDNYNLRIFPMINVDGVIYGNFRCDLGGYDLNRYWKNPSSALHSQIYNIKKQIQMLSIGSGIQFCLDLHTHSKQIGAFAYCCQNSKQCQALPLLLSKITSIFRYPACTFGITSDKRLTARAAVYNMASNANILTIELSAFGFKTRSRIIDPFTPNHMTILAKSILVAIHSYHTGQPPIEISCVRKQLIQQSEINVSLQFDDYDNDGPVSGSDSQPQIDQIQLQVKLMKIFPVSFLEDKFIKSKIRKNKKNKKRINKKQKDSLSLTTQPAYNSPYKIRPAVDYRQRLKTEVQDRDDLTQQKYISPVHQFQIKTPITKTHFYLDKAQLGPKKLIQSEKNNKNQIYKNTKPLNLIQFSLRKLPIFASNKITQPCYIHPNQAEQMVMTVGFDKIKEQTEKKKQQLIKNRKRQLGRFTIYKKSNTKQEELPFLCVMSDNKKLQQIQKIKQRKQGRNINKTQIKARTTQSMSLNNQLEYKNTTILSNTTKEKGKGNLEILSKIWRQNCWRYGESLGGI